MEIFFEDVRRHPGDREATPDTHYRAGKDMDLVGDCLIRRETGRNLGRDSGPSAGRGPFGQVVDELRVFGSLKALVEHGEQTCSVPRQERMGIEP